MPAKITEEEAKQWLRENAPHISILEWSGSSRAPSSFVVGGSVSRYSFSELKNRIRKKLSCGILKETPEKIKDWLEVHAPHIFLLYWAGDSCKKSFFFDQKRNKTFWYASKMLKHEIKRNGSTYGFGSSMSERIKKQESTCLQKYGHKTNLLHPGNIKKQKETNLKRYGAPYPAQNEEVQEKIRKTRLENGTSYSLGGQTISQFLKNNPVCSHSTLLQFCKKHGKEKAIFYQKGVTNNQQPFFDFFKENNIKYELEKIIDGRNSDFFLPDFGLVIECDGFLTHSDITKFGNFSWTSKPAKEKKYHKNKRDHYIKNGHFPLFFREDEIFNQFDVVSSIILNKVGQSKKIGARQTKIKEVLPNEAKQFLNQNHLMKKGSGRSLGLFYKDELVAIVQVKWKAKKEKVLEISRFCTKINHSIIGGFSKLLKGAIKRESPNKIISFVDLRYGSGQSLEKVGFAKTNEDLSFKWTNLKESCGRMTFPKNSGYENGFFKIWDCGQAKYELLIANNQNK